MDVLMQLKEEKEEERFRRLDETIRLHQKNGTLGGSGQRARPFPAVSQEKEIRS